MIFCRNCQYALQQRRPLTRDCRFCEQYRAAAANGSNPAFNASAQVFIQNINTPSTPQNGSFGSSPAFSANPQVFTPNVNTPSTAATESYSKVLTQKINAPSTAAMKSIPPNPCESCKDARYHGRPVDPNCKFCLFYQSLGPEHFAQPSQTLSKSNNLLHVKCQPNHCSWFDPNIPNSSCVPPPGHRLPPERTAEEIYYQAKVDEVAASYDKKWMENLNGLLARCQTQQELDLLWQLWQSDITRKVTAIFEVDPKPKVEPHQNPIDQYRKSYHPKPMQFPGGNNQHCASQPEEKPLNKWQLDTLRRLSDKYNIDYMPKGYWEQERGSPAPSRGSVGSPMERGRDRMRQQS